MQIELWPLDRVKPYHQNPRVNDGAVEAVARSLKEFGFRQPIVVDEAGVIIVGHTRYKAAVHLGMDEVPVHVATGLSPAQAKAYRIADNQTATIATWDKDLLPLELVGGPHLAEPRHASVHANISLPRHTCMWPWTMIPRGTSLGSRSRMVAFLFSARKLWAVPNWGWSGRPVLVPDRISSSDTPAPRPTHHEWHACASLPNSRRRGRGRRARRSSIVDGQFQLGPAQRLAKPGEVEAGDFLHHNARATTICSRALRRRAPHERQCTSKRVTDRVFLRYSY